MPAAARGAAEACVVSLAFWFLLAHLPSTPRHAGVLAFLLVFPHLGMLCWAGPPAVAQRLKETSKWQSRGSWAGVPGVTCGATLALITLRSHPHELSYCNALIGGIRRTERAGMET